MKADSRQVESFLSIANVNFVIPIYQRNYDWTFSQCQQLLDDIYQAGSSDQIKEHFIGSIVYIQEDIYTSAEIKELVIIDGQQRLTTLTLLYLALYRQAKNTNNEKLAEQINEQYLINKFAADASKLKLKATADNDKVLKNLLNNIHEENTEFSNLIANFNYIREFIKDNNYEIIVTGLRKLICVEIALDRGKDSPQRIFESLNSTGLALSQGDLIRNYILMGLEPKQQKQLYQEFWEIIEIKTICETSNKNKISDFIRDYLTLKNKKIPKKNAVYDDFKRSYPNFTFESIKSELANIVKLANHYYKLTNPKQETDADIRTHLQYIDQLEVSVSFPFLMQVYQDYQDQKIDKPTFLQVLELIQSFVWRRFIVGLPTNALNKIFMTLYSKVTVEDYLDSIQSYLCSLTGIQRFPKNKETIDNLEFKDVYYTKNKNTMYLLSRLENFNNNEPVTIDNSKITIEHIFPQNPSAEWKPELADADYNYINDNYLHSISNLTLSGNNGKLGNKSFREKRDLKDAGYKDSRLWLNKFLAQQDTWNEKTIRARFKQISARFLDVWQYPQVETSAIQENNEVNIFEADDPTSKELEYAVFCDEKIEATSMKDFYVKIIKKLFEKDPKLLFADDLKKLHLTEKLSANKLRYPESIDVSYCIETNNSSLVKFDNIKKALELYELEDELFIKYKD
jgi:uncharacterized protein with ParB-like and HNH nuclease domain